MIGVIDTSALVRLFVPDGPVPEGLDDFFKGVERNNNIAIGPELLLAETANVLSRKTELGDFSKAESVQLLADVLSMPIRYFPHGPLITEAFDLAQNYNITVYDAIYLALAIQQGALLFSADKIMIKAADKLGIRK